MVSGQPLQIVNYKLLSNRTLIITLFASDSLLLSIRQHLSYDDCLLSENRALLSSIMRHPIFGINILIHFVSLLYISVLHSHPSPCMPARPLH